MNLKLKKKTTAVSILIAILPIPFPNTSPITYSDSNSVESVICKFELSNIYICTFVFKVD